MKQQTVAFLDFLQVLITVKHLTVNIKDARHPELLYNFCQFQMTNDEMSICGEFRAAPNSDRSHHQPPQPAVSYASSEVSVVV